MRELNNKYETFIGMKLLLQFTMTVIEIFIHLIYHVIKSINTHTKNYTYTRTVSLIVEKCDDIIFQHTDENSQNTKSTIYKS